MLGSRLRFHATPAQAPLCCCLPPLTPAGIWRLVVDGGARVKHIWFLRQLTREEKKHRVRAGRGCCLPKPKLCVAAAQMTAFTDCLLSVLRLCLSA